MSVIDINNLLIYIHRQSGVVYLFIYLFIYLFYFLLFIVLPSNYVVNMHFYIILNQYYFYTVV